MPGSSDDSSCTISAALLAPPPSSKAAGNATFSGVEVDLQHQLPYGRKDSCTMAVLDEQEQQQQQRHSCDESAVVNDDEELLEVMPAMENHGELDTEFDLSARTAGAAQCDNGHLEFALSIAVLQDPFSSGSEQWVMECGGKNTMNLTVANGAGAGGAARSAEGTGQPAKLIHDHPHWTRGECWHDSWMMKALAKAHAPSALMDKGRCPQNVDDGMPWRSEEHRKSLLETAEGCNSEHQDA
eukprot:CAMPEP_0172719934 /NCGR_PEP_ID=MMETSP1074-20121228/75792_1 /TAXON_ID=2916 /ORGANISM="Ceratium fusus, Strain PA161109" /LENGTH=240 /DNA_ID=CAMNT_0013545341 /DNA_START=35 /DNA_END=758 /DNA_ORIENTATION=-